jgi:hypothetical protein
MSTVLYNSRYVQVQACTLVSIVASQNMWERDSLLANNNIEILYAVFHG